MCELALRVVTSSDVSEVRGHGGRLTSDLLQPQHDLSKAAG